MSSFVVIFLIIPHSRFLWEYLSFVKAAGSHRLLLILTFCISILAGYLTVNFLKRKFLIVFIILTTIGYTILNWGHRRLIPEITDDILQQNLWKSTSEGEGHYYANSKWVNVNKPWFSELPKSHLEAVTGIANVEDIQRSSTRHVYIVSAQTPVKFQENTLYFPGWQGRINGKKVLLYPSNSGIITLSAPKGSYRLEIFYSDILIYKIVKAISLTSFFLTTAYLVFYSIKPLYTKFLSFK